VVAGALQVLLVEDNPDDAELIELELCRNGYLPTITRVETGEEMAAALAGGGWDIVLSDFNLPSFSGPAVRTFPSSSCPEWCRPRTRSACSNAGLMIS